MNIIKLPCLIVFAFRRTKYLSSMCHHGTSSCLSAMWPFNKLCSLWSQFKNVSNLSSDSQGLRPHIHMILSNQLSFYFKNFVNRPHLLFINNYIIHYSCNDLVDNHQNWHQRKATINFWLQNGLHVGLWRKIPSIQWYIYYKISLRTMREWVLASFYTISCRIKLKLTFSQYATKFYNIYTIV